jgi:hypothetical protein
VGPRRLGVPRRDCVAWYCRDRDVGVIRLEKPEDGAQRPSLRARDLDAIRKFRKRSIDRVLEGCSRAHIPRNIRLLNHLNAVNRSFFLCLAACRTRLSAKAFHLTGGLPMGPPDGAALNSPALHATKVGAYNRARFISCVILLFASRNGSCAFSTAGQIARLGAEIYTLWPGGVTARREMKKPPFSKSPGCRSPISLAGLNVRKGCAP